MMSLAWPGGGVAGPTGQQVASTLTTFSGGVVLPMRRGCGYCGREHRNIALSYREAEARGVIRWSSRWPAAEGTTCPSGPTPPVDSCRLWSEFVIKEQERNRSG
jgi:hypothetical protein